MIRRGGRGVDSVPSLSREPPRGNGNDQERRRIIAAFAGLLLAVFFLGFSAGAKKLPPAEPLNLNSASVEQLQQVPGIGPGTAKAIVQFRVKSGPFRRVEDLLAIRGITHRKLAKLRPYLTVASPPSGA